MAVHPVSRHVQNKARRRRACEDHTFEDEVVHVSTLRSRVQHKIERQETRTALSAETKVKSTSRRLKKNNLEPIHRLIVISLLSS